ncbi:EamA family transporter [Rhodothalassium salexigens]|uniref:EamA family transporter n=1 Tax=Rhodothalassium salexigens TaxID=1086 RepID=UPI001912AAA0
MALLVMMLWAACYPLISVGLDDAPHLTFAALRAALAGAVLLGVARLARAPLPRRPAQWGWIALAGLGMIGIGYFGMFHGAAFVSPGLATVLENTQPLIAGLLAAVFLGERPGALGWAGLALGVAGIAVIAGPSWGGGGTQAAVPLAGLAFILSATTGVAVGNLAIKQLVRRVDPAMAMGLQLTIGALPLGLLALLLEDPRDIRWTGAFVTSLLGLALPGTALAFWLWQWTLTRLTVANAVAFSFVVPLIGVALGAAFFDEPLTPVRGAGVALSILGVALAAKPRPQAARTPAVAAPGRPDNA